MDSDNFFKVTSEWENKALVNKKNFEKLYDESINDNENFWARQGKRLNWIKPYTKIKDVKYSSKDVYIKFTNKGK